MGRICNTVASMTEHVAQYGSEAVDRLPYSTPEKSQRYRTENYAGAVGLNWYRTDPTLQFTMAYYFQPDQLAVVEPQLTRIGELMGGPVARWAEETDRNPPRLERYDRWGHDISRVVMPASFTQSKRAVLDAQHGVARSGAAARALVRRWRCSCRITCSTRPISEWAARWGPAAAWSSRWWRPMRPPMCATTCWPSSTPASGPAKRRSC